MRKREYYIDGIKFICIILIIITHTFPKTIVNDSLSNIIDNPFGIFGTAMFFMLSGFLMARGYKAKISSDEKRIPFGSYLFNRIKKIYPLYFVTNLICLILLLLNDPSLVSIKGCFTTFLMLRGGSIADSHPFNFPTWFIGSLLVCYSIYYVLVFITIGKKRSNFYYNAVSVLLIIYGYFLLKNHFNFPFMYFHTGEGIFNFFIGVLLNEIFDEIKKRHTIIIGIIFSLTLILILTCDSIFIKDNLRAIVGLIICPSIIILGHNVKILNNILSKIGLFSQNISMPLFFWHIPIYRIFEYYVFQYLYKLSPLAQWLCYLGTLFLVCIISNYITNKTTKFMEKMKRSKNEQTKLSPV